MIDTIKRFSNLLRPYRTDDGALLEDVLGSKVFLEEERMMERELRSMLIAVEDQRREEIYREQNSFREIPLISETSSCALDSCWP